MYLLTEYLMAVYYTHKNKPLLINMNVFVKI